MSHTVPEGSLVTFKCRIKDCDQCLLQWIINDIEADQSVTPLQGSVENTEKGRSITSKLHMTAANTSVVQCWEHNHFAARPSEQNNYSKFALLHVLKIEGSYDYI